MTAVYRLSEAGRKASLVAGGNGHAHQQLTVVVPVARLHLVHVDAKGVARLKLRPRFEMNGDQRVRPIDAPPVYDAPPTIEMLFQDAARNHEHERAFHAQRATARAARQETEAHWRGEIARVFLTDASQRAIAHPAPTPRRCEIATERGRIRFDARRDRGTARDVPLEAFRRFQSDLRAKKSRAQEAHGGQIAVHAEKRRLVGDWIARHGTADQQARQVAGVFPLHEGIEAMADETFRSLAHLPAYTHDGAVRLQAFLRQFPPYAEATITPLDLVVSSRLLTEATSTHWGLMQEINAAVPDTRVLLRERTLAWACNPKTPKLRMVTVLAIKKIGPITLRRELLAPDGRSSVPGSAREEPAMKT
ncbi:MAG: hypothetical protein ACRD2X_25140 [Vicinamibacteraceae bacterium]